MNSCLRLPLLVLSALPLAAGVVTDTTTQSVSVTLNSAAKISAPSTMLLTTAAGTFQNYSASLLLNYEARTTQSGSATLTVRSSADFSPTQGPSIAGGDLTYRCGSANLGTACAGSQVLSTSVQTPVLTVGASACTGSGCASARPATVTLTFTLTNKPQYKTGSYSSHLQFTFSAL